MSRLPCTSLSRFWKCLGDLEPACMHACILYIDRLISIWNFGVYIGFYNHDDISRQKLLRRCWRTTPCSNLFAILCKLSQCLAERSFDLIYQPNSWRHDGWKILKPNSTKHVMSYRAFRRWWITALIWAMAWCPAPPLGFFMHSRRIFKTSMHARYEIRLSAFAKFTRSSFIIAWTKAPWFRCLLETNH